MRLWSSDCVFKAPWKQTTEAVWKKYPNHEMPNVRHIDVLHREVTHEGKLLTTRLIGSEVNFPTLITSLLGLPEMCYAIEYSEVDLKTQEMTLHTTNSTFCSVLSVHEKLTYSPTQENSAMETLLNQSAQVDIKGIPFNSYFEEMIVSRFDVTSQVGRKALQCVLDTLTVENILNRVTDELRDMSNEVDCVACRLDDVFRISEKMSGISRDLDEASSMINTEFHYYSDKFRAEVTQLLDDLDVELSRISLQMSFSSNNNVDSELSHYGNELMLSKIGLFEAMLEAGISVETSR